MPERNEVIEARKNKDNKDYFLKIIEEDPLLIEWANADIRNDKEVMLKAVKLDAGALEFSSDDLKDDKDVVIEAAKNGGWTAVYYSDRLRDDKDVMLEAVKSDGQALYFASEKLRDDEDVVKEAISNKPLIIKYASLRLRSNLEIALLAMNSAGGKLRKTILDFFPTDIQQNEKIKELLEWGILPYEKRKESLEEADQDFDFKEYEDYNIDYNYLRMLRKILIL